MGGAAGHLWHLYDNPNLTFGDLKKMLTLASQGRLENATEKLDGQALHVTWENGELRAARNKGDIKKGGMNASQLAAKFAGRGAIYDAFTTSFDVLEHAVVDLSNKSDIFGGSNRVIWYPIEIIYSQNPNVINYDKNYIVFHESPLIVTDNTGTIVDEDVSDNLAMFMNYATAMQDRVKQQSWNVQKPVLATMQQLSDGSILQATVASVSSIMQSGDVGDKNTIGDYLVNQILHNELKDLDAPIEDKLTLARKLAGLSDTNLVTIKKKFNKSKHKLISQLNSSKHQIVLKYIEPFEMAINEFAIALLQGMKSVFISDNEKEVERLQKETQSAIDAIEASGNEDAMEILSKQLKKLGSLKNITSPSEGVVFKYKNNFYKFTGAFAAVNQILGLFKYGRGKIPSMSKSNESLLRQFIKMF